ncbi:hypothetical protein TEA_016061 [Camellia sinensis var. sinensis]|uniref:ArsA/GET3 Anion-transporting ATPase-like domain-containing protein n=1 Tax=Camellia sinensis var. sinensis TaxID=542762 RepID=A0A4S4EDU4_CAMSN|nr:hypothetical protein TEA_016061 [Camellia sinensis var. sinensis]
MDSDQELPEGTVQNILDQDSLKWVFVGGKGGVGKTTCSSILSILLSRVRPSVLIISTDPAHNLSDAFQQRFTKSPTLINGFTNLYAMEVDPNMENEEALGTDGMDGFLSDLANAIPGIDEAMSFAEMLKLVQTMDYSVIVFDTAPTGHTLRLLQFPSTLEKGLVKMMSLKNKFGGLISQMTRLFGVGDEFGEDAILGKLEGMKELIEQVNMQFKDPNMEVHKFVRKPRGVGLIVRAWGLGLGDWGCVSSKVSSSKPPRCKRSLGAMSIQGFALALIGTPASGQWDWSPGLVSPKGRTLKFLSLYETERLVQELTKFEIDTHNIIINQVLYDEEGVESKLLKARMRMQQKYLDQFYMLYDDFHITKLPLLPEEVCGVDALKSFSRHFLSPYQPSVNEDTVEEVERRVSSLREQLTEAEAELERLRKGKQKV